LVRESPDDAARHGQLGLILAGLGQKDAAIAEGKRAVELLPESQDASMGRRLLLCSRKFTRGPANLMKHFACLIICLLFRTESRFTISSSIRYGTRCVKILASKC